jgi:ureidoglycolate hydrolase
MKSKFEKKPFSNQTFFYWNDNYFLTIVLSKGFDAAVEIYEFKYPNPKIIKRM